MQNALGMGAAATLVLVCSNVVISLLRNVIPDKVGLQLTLPIICRLRFHCVNCSSKHILQYLDKSLVFFLPLIVVNCIILGRAGMFAAKIRFPSALDGLGMEHLASPLPAGYGKYPELIRRRYPVWIPDHRKQFMARSDDYLHFPPGGFFCLRMLSCFGKQNHHQKGQSAEKSNRL